MNKTIQLLNKVMEDVRAIGKNDVNSQQKFNFRGIDSVVNAVGPALRKHGLVIVPEVIEETHDVIPSSSGGQLKVARLKVAYSVFSVDGEPISGTVCAEAFDSGDKATAKAMSVAFRTFLLQVLCIPTDEPDPDSYSYEIGKVNPKTGEVKDWLAVAQATKSLPELQEVYRAARKAGASEALLEQIKALPR